MTKSKPLCAPHRTEGDINLSERRKEWSSANIDRETATLLEEDEKYFLRQSLSTPCIDVLTGSDGIYLETASGRRIIDFHGNSVHQVGYANPRVTEALINQLTTLPFSPRRFTNKSAVDLARKLVELSPEGLGKVLFAPGGTSAIGLAMKLVRYATGRFKTISMWDSFHGASMDALSLGGEALFREGLGPLLPGAEHVPPPAPEGCPFGCEGTCNMRCADYIDYVLEKQGDVGAVFAEPMRATTVSVPPPEYWQRVRKACDKHGALLVFDEIAVGMGRTGKMFSCEHFGVTPDILVLGKGLGGAVFPMAAVVARSDLDVVPDRALGHYTHEKSSLGAAAALATIECLEKDGLLENAREMGGYAMDKLRKLQEKYPLIADVRGIGLQLAVELRTGEGKAIDEAEQVLYGALTRGLSFKISDGNVLTLAPPLIINREQMDSALSILDDCLAAVSLSKP